MSKRRQQLESNYVFRFLLIFFIFLDKSIYIQLSGNFITYCETMILMKDDQENVIYIIDICFSVTNNQSRMSSMI